MDSAPNSTVMISLWTVPDLIAATDAVSDGTTPGDITGVSIDTRTIKPGDLFVALKDTRDGHDFVATAFNKGAAAALVARHYGRQPDDVLLLRVDDPLVALEALGRAARNRLSPDARVIAVTGSAGKTTTKEMLRTALAAIGPTHASEKSYNNHWGVPLTLARMPASTRFGVFEIGMNHACEITPLSRMVRPHIAIITTVGEAHIEHFPDGVAGIARAKAEIFAGLEPGGTAILPIESQYFELLAGAVAPGCTIRTFCFGGGPNDSPADAHVASAGPRLVVIKLGSGTDRMFNVEWNADGSHMARNMSAVALTVNELLGPWTEHFSPEETERSQNWQKARQSLSGWTPAAGRGARTLLGQSAEILLIDESYNANPASMRAALAMLAQVPRDRYPRRIAVLGDMLELGADAPQLHAGLAADLDAAAVDLVLACGPNMKHLYAALPTSRQGTWAETSAGLVGALLDVVRPGDVVMIKGSNGSRMAPLVDALKSRHDLAAPPR